MAAWGYNKVTLVGNLARDPEIRYSANKQAYGYMSVACSYSYKKNDQYVDACDFVPVSMFGALAERCGKYLKKGSKVLVEGKISVTSFEAKDGSGKKYKTDVSARDVIFLSSAKDGNGGGYGRDDGDPFGGPSGDGYGNQSGKGSGKGSAPKGGHNEFDFPIDFSEMDGEEESDIPF